MGALYRTDGDGRLLCTNEWDQRPAPRFYLMRTAQGPIARYRADLPNHLVQRLEDLCRNEASDGPPAKLPAQYDEFLKALADHAPVDSVWSGPAYVLPPGRPQSRESTAIDEGNAGLLRPRFADWLPDVPHRRPFMAVLDAGGAASICASVRISAGVHCAGVETHPDFRMKGYAVEVVSAWARAVRSEGATPFYSTSWDNLASQQVAERLGARPVGVDFHVT